ncbi:MAG: restriction endonuclease subunit S [Candidatus Binatia bacterium]
MIDGLKPYAAMKDSGVPWLGEVPEHWEVRPVAGLGSLFKGNGGDKGDEVPTGVPCVRYGDLYTRHEFFITRSKACVSEERASEYTPIHYGDVLFAASGETMEDIGRSAVNLIAGQARCGGDVLVLRPKVPAVPLYLGYAADSPASRHQKACMGRGFTVVHIYGSELKRLLLPLPPLPEQAAIVRFLDYADRRIRRYIRAKQNLIKLLEEQKQAIIHRAVTRGLDPNVRLKPSRLEWLGDVPEHWEVMRLARVIRDGPRNGISPPVDERGTIESFSISAIREGAVDVREGYKKYISGDKATLERAYCLLRGDVLLVRGNGNIRLVGKAGLVEDDMPGRVYPDLLMRVRLTCMCLPGFLVALLNGPTGRDQIETAARTAVGTFKINNQHVRQLGFALPPAAEQQRIVDWLSDELSAVKTASHSAEDGISLLREYRTRLIADVVTGKLDVREAAARLPDEPDEPEPAEEAEAPLDDEESQADDLDAIPEEAEA